MIPEPDKLYLIKSKGLGIESIGKFLRKTEDGLYSFLLKYDEAIYFFMEESIIEEVKEK